MIAGETKRADKLGYAGRAMCICLACSKCGKLRWVKMSELRNPTRAAMRELCNKCAAQKRSLAYRTHGRAFTAQGYVMLRIYPGEPYFEMATKQGRMYRILEHRLVVARSLGRLLKPWEMVHHINGIKNDNRLDNLELLPAHIGNLVNQSYRLLTERVAELESRVQELEAMNKVQVLQIKSLRDGNTELSLPRSISRQESVETRTEGTPPDNVQKRPAPGTGGDIVQPS